MGRVLLPGTAFLELALHVGGEVGCGRVQELTLEVPLVLDEERAVQLQVVVGELDDGGRRTLSVYSRPEGGWVDGVDGGDGWTLHVSGVLVGDEGEGVVVGGGVESLLGGVWPPVGAERVVVDDLYDVLAESGLDYGPAFQGLGSVWRRDDEVFAEVALGEQARDQAGLFGVHPALLDAALHGIDGGLLGGGERPGGVMLPFSWGGVVLRARGASVLRVRLAGAGPDAVSVVVADEGGALVASVDSLVLRAAPVDLFDGAGGWRKSLFGVDWVEVSAVSGCAGRVAVLGGGGEELVGSLRAAGVSADCFGDLESLVAGLASGGEVPEVVLVDWASDAGCAQLGGVGSGELGGVGSGELGGVGSGELGGVGSGELGGVGSGELGGVGSGEVLGEGEGEVLGGLPGVARGAAHRALGVVQGWLVDERLGESRLVVLTRSAVSVGSGEGVRGLGSAAVWGLVRSAQVESPGRFVLLDVDGSESAWGALPLVLGCDEPQLAVREGVAYAPRLTRVGSGKALVPPAGVGEWRLQAGDSGTASSLDPQGTVLVTGGTGGLGALVARHLVLEHGVRSAVLASRRGLEAPGAPELVVELEQLGARVEAVACDVADRAQLQALIDAVPSEFPLRGVVHAAGVLDDGLIGSLTGEHLDRVMTPKVDAAWHLHELTAHLNLEMFVLFSSTAGVFGGPGQGNYAAANAFLDALAADRRAHGLPAVATAWGLWDADVTRMESAGMGALSTEEGLALFDAACAMDSSLVVAARLDLAALRARARTGALPAFLRGLVREPVRRVSGGVVGSLARRLEGVAEEERPGVVLELVRAETAGVLGHASLEAVDAQRAFKDMGLDSLGAVELRNRLNTFAGLRLEATVAFDYPSPVALAGYLLELVTGAHKSAAGVALVRSLDEPVAIVGMSCRYPGGVGSPKELWDLVAGGVDAVGALPSDRGLGLEVGYGSDLDGSGGGYTREGAFLDDAVKFDAAFFGIGPREALAMDPQQRQLLEACWEALEDGGLDPRALKGSQSGVFVGVGDQGYGAGRELEDLEGYRLTGSTVSVASGRVAYVLGLEGPAVSIDTACSSSLVALHLACGALRGGECSLALAGGVTVMSTLGLSAEFARQRGLAMDGRCKPFANAADGTSFSEGVGMLVLERLSDAQRNGHRVLAVVRGSAVNQDGASNGLTAPNGPSQQRVIMQALAGAGLSPVQIDAVEAHGTGTRLGDPIEAQALLATYGQGRREERPLWLGSIKSNIGHTQTAAGVAGVIKMVMAMRHGVLPRTLHVDEPSKEVDWSSGNVSLLTEEVPWEKSEKPRRAGVSSFGVSGTNAHLILEEAPAAVDVAAGVQGDVLRGSGVSDGDGPDAAGGLDGAGGTVGAGVGGVVPWVLSGRGVGGLRGQAGRLGGFVAGDVGVGVVDVGFSLAGRAVFEDRAVVLGGGREELLAGVGVLAGGDGWGEDARGVVRGVAGGVGGGLALLFPGQGSQRVGMGAGLYEAFGVFRDAFDEVCGFLDVGLGCSLREVVFGGSGSVGVGGGLAGGGLAGGGLLDETVFTQAGLFALGVALWRLVEGWGVRPGFVVGHSVGEVVGAYVAGVFSLEDACRLVGARGRLMGGLPRGGAMVAVQAGEVEVLESLVGFEGRVSLAAVNGPSAVVVSGDEGAVLEVAGVWEERGRKTRRLRVSHAFHSPLVEGMLGEFREVLEGLSFCEPVLPVVSNVTGGVVSGERLRDPGYWVEQARATVRFGDGVRWLYAQGVRCFLELGSDGVLSAMVGECVGEDVGGAGEGLGAVGGVAVTAVPVLRSGRSDVEALLRAVGEVWTRGAEVDWGAFYAQSGARKVDLPTYAFQRERFWLEPGGEGDVASVGQGAVDHPLLGAAVALADGGGWLFTGRVSLDAERWLGDHVVMGRVLLPGTAFLELALHVGGEVGCGRVQELTLEVPLVLDEERAVQLQVVVGELDDGGRRTLSVYSRPEGGWVDGVDGGDGWTLHVSGVLVGDEGEGVVVGGGVESLLGGVWPPVGAERVVVDDLYDVLAESGLDYGPAFQGLGSVWRRDDEVFAEVALGEQARDQAGLFGVHPALLDAALHGIDGGLLGGGERPGGVMLPFSWGGVVLRARGASVLRVRLAGAGPDAVSVVVADEGGALVASVDSLVLRAAPVDLFDGAGGWRKSLFGVDWVEVSAVSGCAGRVAVLGGGGEELVGSLRAAGVSADCFGDLESLVAGLASGGEVPEVVLVDWASDAGCAQLGGVQLGGVQLGGVGSGELGGVGSGELGGVGSGELGGVGSGEVLGEGEGEVLGGLPGVARGAAHRALGVVQGWLVDERLGESRLVVLTRSAVSVGSGEGVRGLGSAAVWGLVRSAQVESPGRFVLLDVDGSESAWGALPLVLGCDEPQLAVREGVAYAPRLTRVGSGKALVPPAGVGEWRLQAGDSGTLDGLCLARCPWEGEPLGAGQVRVGMRAAGLNFRDVLIALGAYPGVGDIGREGAGVVLELGPGVEDLVVGDCVMGALEGAFGPVAVSDRRLLTRMPEGWSFAEAASVPIVFLTAYYALCDLACVQRGERLLVHAAAGGVGMAAVQLAQYLGVEVFATASPGKWGALEAMGLDRAHIASSRDLEFGEQFLEATGGRGVDVVLNSLTGEFVDASLGLLVGGGRFIEMGKTDIRDSGEVTVEHAGVSYRAFDLMDAEPERIQEMLVEVLGLFEAGALELLPVRAWDVRRAREAFRFMSQARHVGKVVLTLPASSLDPQGTVLVTGGTGGLGALVARHLVLEHGVRSLVLASRRGPEAPGALELVGELEQLGARVEAAACDVADRAQLQALIEAVPGEYPLRGVVHAAGVLDDGVIGSLTGERLDRVMTPKVNAAWHLHELTTHLNLEMFVLFSSAAGVLGGPGQGNYAAANAFLDALAADRHAHGQPATATAWGLWAQATGMTGELRDTDVTRMESAGMGALSTEEGLALFDAARAMDSSLVVAARLEIARWRVREGEQLPAFLRGLVREPVRRVSGGAAGSLAQRLAGVSEEERPGVVLELVRAETAGVLGHASLEAVDAQRAFKDMGLDSLGAVELRNRLNTLSGLRLGATVVFDYASPVALAGYLLDLVMGAQQEPAAGVALVRSHDEPVAIVGMSCRYPGGVGSPEELWDLVAGGVDAVGVFPSDRGLGLEVGNGSDPGRAGGGYTREGGFLDDAVGFDAAFFGIGPREALAMDPQQRHLLEVCWEALEDGGLDPRSLKGSQSGVFVGVGDQGYGLGSGRAFEGLEGYRLTGSTVSVASGRVAYVFGLEGPAVSVDTACSSSLVALHLACGALRGGECSLALAGGVTVMSTPGVFAEFAHQRGLAMDGRCKPFANAADGTGFSEGVGMLVLERLSDAQRNGHRVLAVVRGSAVNQDGASNGLTAPNGPSQQRVIMQALAGAGLSPVQVDAVEGHGTGTRLGDPIEAQALLATYGQGRREERPLWLGSIKSNIGHTQTAAGVAGVIKMVMAMRHGVLPRTLHVDEPSKEVDWSSGNVSLLTEEVPWEKSEKPRRAGVSSFGVSGTNAHLILEEALAPADVTAKAGDGVLVGDESDAAGEAGEAGEAGVGGVLGGVVPWVLSGRGVGGLRGQAGRLGGFVAGDVGVGVVDVGFSLAGRAVFEDRAVVLGGGREELLAGVGVLAGGDGWGEDARGVVRGVAGGVGGGLALLFPGQGSQRVGMGAGLYEAFGVFRDAFDEVCGFLDVGLGCSLREVVFGGSGSVGVGGGLAGGGLLDETVFTQAGLFALGVALWRLVEGWGVRPGFVVGHSVGEVVGAYVAGVFSLEDACRLVGARGRLMGGLPRGGAMVAVQAGEVEVLESLVGFEGRVSLAAVNGPSAVVVSGDEGAVLEVAGVWEERGRKTRRLRVSHAFHSPLVEGMLGEFREVLEGLSFCEPVLPVVSNVTGGVVSGERLRDPGYWVEQARATVRFGDGVRWLYAQGVRCFLELGSDGVLSAMVGECVGEDVGGAGEGLGAVGGVAVTAVPVLRSGRSDVEALLRAVGEVWTRGAEVDWGAFYAQSGARKVDLPTYAFQRERFWLEPGGEGDVASVGQGAVDHPLLGAAVALADGGGWLFTGRVSLDAERWLGDHVVMGRVLLPGTAFLELALHVGGEVGCGRVQELTLEVPLVLDEERAVQLQVVVGELDDGGRRTLSVHSRPEHVEGSGGGLAHGDEWTQHASGVLACEELEEERVADAAMASLVGEAWPAVDAVPVAVNGLYEELSREGLDYGPVFRGLRAVWRRGDEVFAEVELLAEERSRADPFGIHPALLDAALHGIAEGMGENRSERGGVRLPFSWNDAMLYATGASVLRVRLAPGDSNGVSIVAADENGAPVASVSSLSTRELSEEQLVAPERDGSMFHIHWVAPRTRSAGAGSPAGWAVLGEAGVGLAGALGAVGLQPRCDAELAALGEAVDGGMRVPTDVLVGCGTHEDSAAEIVGAGGEGELGHLARVAHALSHWALELVQAWLADERFSDSRLIMVTQGALALAGGDGVPGLAQAPIWGLLRTAQSEHPDRLVLVDVDGEESTWRMLPEALASREPQVAVREGRLYVPRLARMASADGGSSEVGLPGDEAPLFDPERTVLITGGTGGLGALVARRLVSAHGVRSILLASRRGPQAETAPALEAELSALGARVRIAACDVADREQVAALLGSVPPEHPLGAVVHAAGALDDGVIGSLTSERMDRVLTPKIDSAWHLHELTEHLDLSAFVLFSSFAATLGAAGQGNYAAANAFLDALAAYRRARGLRAVSIAWGLWERTSSMTAHLGEADVARMVRSGLRALSSEEGLELLDAACESDEALVVAARMDLAVLRARARTGALPAPLRGLIRLPPRPVVDGGGGSLAARLSRAPDTEHRRIALELTVAQVAAVLGHASAEAIDPLQTFKDMGFDSLAAVDLRNRLNAETRLRLPATLVFDHPNSAAVAQRLLEELALREPAAAEPVEAELTRLERELPAIFADDARRRRMTARLSALLDRMSMGETEVEDEDVRHATADEVFALIDREIGPSEHDGEGDRT